MEKVTIRSFKKKDTAAVMNLFRLNTPEYFSEDEEEDLKHYLEGKIEAYYVMEINNLIVGSGGINFSNDRTIGIISWDIIHPSFQGRRLGRLLLAYRMKKLNQMTTIRTISVRTSQLAYKFYEKSGFKLIEKVKDYWAPGFDMYRMELQRSQTKPCNFV